MVGSHALLVVLADGSVSAGAGAAPGVAVEVGGAVQVGLAGARGGRSWRHDRTLASEVQAAPHVRLSGVAFRALAPWEVVDHPAEGVLAAGGSEGARVDALAGLAKLVERTVRVHRAAHYRCGQGSVYITFTFS